MLYNGFEKILLINIILQLIRLNMVLGIVFSSLVIQLSVSGYIVAPIRKEIVIKFTSRLKVFTKKNSFIGCSANFCQL